jgi:hypothetical protein
VVDIIDIRYWHYNTKGLWAPEGGKNMAPRQWMRKMKVGKTGFDEAYKSVKEMRDRYPDKAVTFFSQQYPDYGWAILMAGGSLPNIPISNMTADNIQKQFLQDVCQMIPLEGKGCVALGNAGTGYLIYAQADDISLPIADGKYTIYSINSKNGAIQQRQKKVVMKGAFNPEETRSGQLFWLKKQ